MEITRASIMNELKKRGYEVAENDVYKNGVKMEAIIIREDRITPTLYVKPIISRASSVEEAADIAERIYRESNSVNINLDELLSPDYIKSNVRIGLEHSNEHITAIHRDSEYDGLTEYLYFSGTDGDGNALSIKLTDGLVKKNGLDESKLWEIALERTMADVTIKGMSEIIAEMTDDYEMPKEMQEKEFMFVITNKNTCKGAAGILNRELLKQFAEEHDCKKLVIIPSSIHECILVPVEEDECDVERFNEMIREVNSTQVTPDEVLLDRAIVVNFD